MAHDLRDHNFVTQGFGHEAPRELAKHEIATHLKVGPMIIACGHMEAGAKGK
jgi:hypothetical protein